MISTRAFARVGPVVSLRAVVVPLLRISSHVLREQNSIAKKPWALELKLNVQANANNFLDRCPTFESYAIPPFKLRSKTPCCRRVIARWYLLLIAQQLTRSRTFATVTDAPLDKKVEMTNWEKVCFYNGKHPPL
jgi:hypothetical protein